MTREKQITIISDYVHQAIGVAFHNLISYNNWDITFIFKEKEDIIEISLEKFDPYVCKNIKWDEVTDEMLVEIISIIESKN